MKSLAPCVLFAAALFLPLPAGPPFRPRSPHGGRLCPSGNKANKNFGIAGTLKARTKRSRGKNFDSYLKFDTTYPGLLGGQTEALRFPLQ